MRQMLELAGFACVIVAAFLVSVPLGIALVGVALILAGNA